MRRGGMGLVLAIATLAAMSACGGASDDSAGVASANGGATAPASAGASPSEDSAAQALKFAQCMRDNGVPDFPDPDPNGGFSGMADRFDDPAVEKALQACRSELPGSRREALRDPKTQEKLRQLAQCLRDEGFDVPDPDPNNPGALLGANPGVDRSDPKFRQAVEACQSKVGFNPGGGR